jgi:hypothetical protein
MGPPTRFAVTPPTARNPVGTSYDLSLTSAISTPALNPHAPYPIRRAGRGTLRASKPLQARFLVLGDAAPPRLLDEGLRPQTPACTAWPIDEKLFRVDCLSDLKRHPALAAHTGI